MSENPFSVRDPSDGKSFTLDLAASLAEARQQLADFKARLDEASRCIESKDRENRALRDELAKARTALAEKSAEADDLLSDFKRAYAGKSRICASYRRIAIEYRAILAEERALRAFPVIEKFTQEEVL